MESFKSTIIVLLLAFGLLTPIAQGKSPGMLLQEGLYAEEMEGDLGKAMEIYEQIIADKSSSKDFKAQAMYRLGMCYLKKREEGRAKGIFEKLVALYPEQKVIIAKVKPLLDDISYSDPAELMPAETKIYIELGSPGRQIETILNMLKGTPFENPLAVIGGGQQQPSGQKSPGDMIAALLNPSMMAEFKKIRGMAVGVTTIGNNPDVVVVLYPGKSDALRGLLLAGLGMAGKPGEAIEGMQTVRIGDNAGVAHDDNVFIISQPIEQLEWCVKQYKGVTDEPTLVSENKIFGKLSREKREKNAVTIWFDGKSTFAAISKQFAGSGQNAQLQLVDGIVDFNNINEVVAHLSIEQNSIAVEVNVGFEQGHNSLAYNLIRTPNLTKAGFEAVPSEAVAVVSFALGEAEGAGAVRAQKAIKNITGLDIGRELFANIEQITLFAVPAKAGFKENVLGKNISPVLPGLGLVVTSHNPQKSRQLLEQFLSVANLLVTAQSGKAAPPENNTEGKYNIGIFNDKVVSCYMDQIGKSTILALSPDVLKASLSAVKTRQSVLTAGPLQRSLSHISGDMSKLAVVNIGGAIKAADAHIHRTVESSEKGENLPLSQKLGQLAQACDMTSVRLCTRENDNSFGLQISVSDLPALKSVFGLLMQLSGVKMENLTSKAIGPQPSDGKIINTDAKVKLKWVPGMFSTSHKVYFGTKAEELSLLGEVKKSSFSELPGIEDGKIYYWRVDEIQGDGTVVTGELWSFSVRDVIGYWEFNEGPIASKVKSEVGAIKDISGGGSDATVLTIPGADEPVYSTGCPGHSDGVAIKTVKNTHLIKVAKSKIPDLGSFTLEALIKTTSEQADYIAIHGDTGYEWWLRLENGKPRFLINLGRGHEDFYGKTAVNDGKWHHVAVVRDTSAGKVEVFVDGIVDGSTKTKKNDTIRIDAPLYMLGFAVFDSNNALANSDNSFEGQVDFIKITNKALVPDEFMLPAQQIASRPKPANAVQVSLIIKPELSWRPGTNASTHKIYFGTQVDKLSLLAELTVPEFTELPKLQDGRVYYWRIDEVQKDGSAITGDVWSFKTGELVGWWKFDEGSGNIAADSSNNGNNGTLNNMDDSAWVAGTFGKALDFDGKDDYVIVQDNEALEFKDESFSIVFGMKSSIADRDCRIIINGTSGTEFEGATGKRYEIINDAGRKKIRFVIDDDKNKSYVSVSSKYFATGKWVHVVAVRDTEAGELRFYVDGQLQGTAKDESGDISSPGEALYIGMAQREEQSPDIGRFFPGTLDDMRIYNYALSQEEVKALYNGK